MPRDQRDHLARVPPSITRLEALVAGQSRMIFTGRRLRTSSRPARRREGLLRAAPWAAFVLRGPDCRRAARRPLWRRPQVCLAGNWLPQASIVGATGSAGVVFQGKTRACAQRNPVSPRAQSAVISRRAHRRQKVMVMVICRWHEGLDQSREFTARLRTASPCAVRVPPSWPRKLALSWPRLRATSGSLFEAAEQRKHSGSGSPV